MEERGDGKGIPAKVRVSGINTKVRVRVCEKMLRCSGLDGVCTAAVDAAKARRRVGELRWSLRVARLNYEQFGGRLDPTHPLLDMLAHDDFGDQRPVPVVVSPPADRIEAEKVAAVEK